MIRIPIWALDVLNDAEFPNIDIHLLKEAQEKYILFYNIEKNKAEAQELDMGY